MSIFHRFGLTFLLFFGAFILYFNWVIGYNNALAENGRSFVTPFLGFLYPVNGWSGDYFFGFKPIIRLFQNFSFGFEFSTIWQSTQDFISTQEGFSNFSVSLTQLIELSQNGGGDVITTLKLIFRFIQCVIALLEPLTGMLLGLIQLIVNTVWSLVNIISAITVTLGGLFNQHMSDYAAPISLYINNTNSAGHLQNIYWLPTWVNGSISYISTSMSA